MPISIYSLLLMEQERDPSYLRDGVHWCRHLAAQPDQSQMRDYLDDAGLSTAQVEYTCAAVASKGASLSNVDHIDPIGRTMLATVERLHEPIAQLLVLDPVVSARYALALNPTTRSELLTQLACDTDPIVCAAVAENSATDTTTLVELAHHADDYVREWAQLGLARRGQ